MSNNNTPSKVEAPKEWDGRCVLGHCGSPSGCEYDMRCRADVGAPDAANAGEPAAKPLAYAFPGFAERGENDSPLRTVSIVKFSGFTEPLFATPTGVAADEPRELDLRGEGDFLPSAPATWEDEYRRIWARWQAAEHNKLLYRRLWKAGGVAADESTRAPDGVALPKALAWKLMGLLSQELAVCADPDCRISSNPEADVTECREALYAALKASGERPSAPAPEFDADVILSLADQHAAESRENGQRVFDRGDLVAFVIDLLARDAIRRAGMERTHG